MNVLERIVKKRSLEKFQNDLKKINLKDESNFKAVDNIKLDVGTKLALKKVKSISEKTVFLTDCRTILKNFLVKLIEKSPLKYPFVKCISCLNPDVTLQQKEAESRLSKAVEILAENNIMSTTICNKIESEFKQIISLTATKEKLKSFKRSETRLDHFWFKVIEMYGFDNYSNLFHFIKTVMILAHGNAFLERGFSINNECIVENQKEKSLIAQRIICDSINNTEHPIEKFVIDKKLLQCVRSSKSLYKQELEKEKEKRDREQNDKCKQALAAAQLKDLEKRKQKILDNAQKEAAKLEEEMYILKKC